MIQNYQAATIYKEGEDMALSDEQRFAMYPAEGVGNAMKKRCGQLKITQKKFARSIPVSLY